jgi:hypothetical protein
VPTAIPVAIPEQISTADDGVIGLRLKQSRKPRGSLVWESSSGVAHTPTNHAKGRLCATRSPAYGSVFLPNGTPAWDDPHGESEFLLS